MEDIPIIETSVGNQFDWAMRHIAKTAGLGVVRGQLASERALQFREWQKLFKRKTSTLLL